MERRNRREWNLSKALEETGSFPNTHVGEIYDDFPQKEDYQRDRHACHKLREANPPILLHNQRYAAAGSDRSGEREVVR